MEVIFKNSYLEKLYMGTKITGKPLYNEDVIKSFRKKINFLIQASDLIELDTVNGLNFEALKGDRQGLYSIRINNKYRLEFSIEQNALALKDIILVEKISNHYKEDMENYQNEPIRWSYINHDVLLHPGEVLGDELECRKIPRKSFAKAIKVTPEYLQELIAGIHPVTPIVAIRLEQELKINASLWMRLQAGYDLSIAHRELKVDMV